MSDTVLLVILYILLALILVFTVFLALGYLDPKVERWNKRMKKILKRAKKNQNNWTEMQLLKLDVKELLDKMIPAYEKGYLRKANELNQVINLLKEVLQATDANSMILTFSKTKDLLQLLVLMKKQQDYQEYLQAQALFRASNSRRSRPVRRRRSAGLFDAFPNNSSNQSKGRKLSNYHDNHWESSFDWQDRNNDGYDDRNDGFWQEAE